MPSSASTSSAAMINSTLLISVTHPDYRRECKQQAVHWQLPCLDGEGLVRRNNIDDGRSMIREINTSCIQSIAFCQGGHLHGRTPLRMTAQDPALASEFYGQRVSRSRSQPAVHTTLDP